MTTNKPISEEGAALLMALSEADHLYCSSFQRSEYFGAFVPVDEKGEYKPIDTNHSIVNELCQNGYLFALEEPMETLAGTIDQRWALTDLGRSMLSKKLVH